MTTSQPTTPPTVNMLYTIFSTGSMFLEVVRIAILIYCILSWFRPSWSAFYWLERFIQPFVLPFRKLSYAIMRKSGLPLDFSCWFALIGVSILSRVWWMLYSLIARGSMMMF